MVCDSAGEEGWSSEFTVWCQGEASCHSWRTSSNHAFPILVAASAGEEKEQRLGADGAKA